MTRDGSATAPLLPSMTRIRKRMGQLGYSWYYAHLILEEDRSVVRQREQLMRARRALLLLWRWRNATLAVSDTSHPSTFMLHPRPPSVSPRCLSSCSDQGMLGEASRSGWHERDHSRLDYREQGDAYPVELLHDGVGKLVIQHAPVHQLAQRVHQAKSQRSAAVQRGSCHSRAQLHLRCGCPLLPMPKATWSCFFGRRLPTHSRSRRSLPTRTHVDASVALQATVTGMQLRPPLPTLFSS